MDRQTALAQLRDRARAWDAAGRVTSDGAAWQLLAGSLRLAIDSGDDELLADLMDSLNDAGLASALTAALQDLIDLDPYFDPATLRYRVHELFALPVRILFAGRDPAYVLGKPVGPAPMAAVEQATAQLFGGAARVRLLPAFFDRNDLLTPWPSGADALRRMLADGLDGRPPRVRVSPAARPMQATRMRRSFVRFVVGVTDRDFAGGRALTERRFGADALDRWKSAAEQALDSVLATMGADLRATAARPTTFSHALTQPLRF